LRGQISVEELSKTLSTQSNLLRYGFYWLVFQLCITDSIQIQHRVSEHALSMHQDASNTAA